MERQDICVLNFVVIRSNLELWGLESCLWAKTFNALSVTKFNFAITSFWLVESTCCLPFKLAGQLWPRGFLYVCHGVWVVHGAKGKQPHPGIYVWTVWSLFYWGRGHLKCQVWTHIYLHRPTAHMPRHSSGCQSLNWSIFRQAPLCAWLPLYHKSIHRLRNRVSKNF